MGMITGHLDYLVATHVLGQTPDPNAMKLGRYRWYWAEKIQGTGEYDEVDWPPPYSTKMGRAFELLETLRIDHCCITIISNFHYCWRIEMIKDQDLGNSDLIDYKHRPYVVVDGVESLPEAMCYAALLAKGVNLKGVTNLADGE